MVRRRRWLHYALAPLVFAGLALPSCGAGFDPPSKVNTLRVLGVTIDKPYALAGDEITFRMTLADGLGNEDGEPRDVQLVWLAGCFNPESDFWFRCFEQMAEQFQSLGGGGLPDGDFVQVGLAAGTSSGQPDAHEFTLRLPDDLVSRRPKPDIGPHYGNAFVFYAACAGSLAPANLETLQPFEEGDPLSLPLQCLDAAGNPLGAESFVVGYTEVYAFADERGNQNPPVDGMLFREEEMSETFDEIPIVPPCSLTEAERKQPGCSEGLEGCDGHKLKAIIGDIAEVDPEATSAEGQPIREVIWVNYLADRGDINQYTVLVSDATQGYLGDHEVLWYPPAEPGIASLWAVARDQRGGQTVIRRFVRVQ